MNEIRSKVEEIFRNMFPGAGELTMETASGDIHAWDSLNHVLLISKVEEKFDIKFELDEILSSQSIGAICSAVEKKLDA